MTESINTATSGGLRVTKWCHQPHPQGVASLASEVYHNKHDRPSDLGSAQVELGSPHLWLHDPCCLGPQRGQHLYGTGRASFGFAL